MRFISTINYIQTAVFATFGNENRIKTVQSAVMATVLKFRTSLADLQEEIELRQIRAETSSREKFLAARKIQAWIRGILTRAHLRSLHKKATVIQCHWRGHRGRIIADDYLIQRVHQMWQDHYNCMATKIQAIWRGYWVRKTRLDLRQMRRWLDTVYVKNKETLENMKTFRRNVVEQIRDNLQQESIVWILFILFKLHHLMGTKRRPGVIARIDKRNFTAVEEMLQCLEYTHYIPERHSDCEDCRIDPKPSLVFRGTYFERCEMEIREFEKSLRAGVLPIFRSEPYEEGEAQRRKAQQEIKWQRKHKAKLDSRNSIRENGSCSSSKSKLPRGESGHLYDEICRMDCHLDELHIKCPIHHSNLSSC